MSYFPDQSVTRVEDRLSFGGRPGGSQHRHSYLHTGADSHEPLIGKRKPRLERVSKGKGHCRASATGKFPLRFGGQGVSAARALAQAVEKFHGIVPTHVVDRALI